MSSMRRCALLLLVALVSGCSLPRVTLIEDPLTAEEHLQLGLAYEQQGELDLALREYRKASEEVPEARLYLGNVHFLRQEYRLAERAYRRAIDTLANDPRPYNNLAWLYYKQDKHLDEAEALARRAVELAPNHKDAEYRDTLERIRAARDTQR